MLDQKLGSSIDFIGTLLRWKVVRSVTDWRCCFGLYPFFPDDRVLDRGDVRAYVPEHLSVGACLFL